MAQTTDGMTFTKALVFVSPDGSTWTDVSGHGASVAVGGGERITGEEHTFEGDTPIVSGGKRDAIELTVRYVYSEGVADPFAICRTAHETAPGTFYCQYRVKDSGNWFKTGAGILTNPGYPGGEAKSGDTVMSEFAMKCAALTEAAAST